MERFLSNDRLIALHRNRLDLTPFEVDKLYIGYEDAKYQQFWLHLAKQSLDLNMVKKVILECYNMLQNGEEVYKFALRNPVLFDTIMNYMQHFKSEPEDPCNKFYEETRVLASMCFKQFCKVLVVKEKMHVCKYIEDIYLSFDDDVEDVRVNVYLGLIYYAQSRYGIDSLLVNTILEKIVKKITEEKSMKVLNLILILINEILNAQGAPEIALNNEILLNLKLYINTEDMNVLKSVLQCYGYLSICDEGKVACLKEGSLIENFLNKINSVLSENSPYSETDGVDILIYTTRFLMNLSLEIKAKKEIFERKGIESLFNVLNSKFKEDPQLVLNILQCLTNTAEEPRARKFLLQEEYLNQVKDYKNNSDEFIKEQAGTLEEVICWEP